MTWPPTFTKQYFKFQILPGQGKMANPPNTSPKILNFRFVPGHRKLPWSPNPHWTFFKFQIWPGHGKMTDPNLTKHFEISDWAWTWKDDWSPTSPKNINFRFGLDMVRWPTPQPSLKFLNFRFYLDPQPSLNIFKLQIWPGHGKMNDPPNLTKHFKFQIGPGHGKMPDPLPQQTI